jgi:hypothetical protein
VSSAAARAPATDQLVAAESRAQAAEKELAELRAQATTRPPARAKKADIESLVL